MLKTQLLNDLINDCNNELLNYNNLIIKTADKQTNKIYMRHIQALQKIIHSIQVYKNLETPEEAMKRKG